MDGSRAITKDEWQRMLQNSYSERDTLLLMLGKAFGLRISEALQFRLMDLIDQKKVFIVAAKGSKNGKYDIPKIIHIQAQKVVQEYKSKGIKIDAQTPALVSRNGQKRGGTSIAIRTANYIFTRIKQRAGITTGDLSFHGLRKAYATYYYEKTGHDLYQTIRYTRHKSIKTLQHYIRVSKPVILEDDLDW